MKNTINVLEALKVAALKYADQQKEWGGTREFKPALKYFKKLELFKASNVSFDPSDMVALSYGWWQFVKVINGRVVYNSYRYSPSTGKHQSKVKGLLDQLGIKIDLKIESPKGLQDLDSALAHYEYQIEKLQEQIANTKSRALKNAERRNGIADYQGKIRDVLRLQGVSQRKAA